MEFAKWGNSLAVRIPADVVAKLGPSPEEEAQIRGMTGEHSVEVIRACIREGAQEKIRRLRFTVHENYSFDRSEIYDR